ncbi:MAG: ribosomal protein S18 acetylase RimI-like enzyme [Cyclobacteriaceae bacterium]|jgi:ribosomal protein S18 acetylase RimI-like enzyme
MDVKPFSPPDLATLHTAFNLAFSTYSVPFQPSLDTFRSRVFQKLNIESNLSLLAFQEETCIAFLLHAIGPYESVKTIYNGGTGVVPNQRGAKLTERLYNSLLPALQASHAKRIVLEVIDTNKPAQKVYGHLGFLYKQTFNCYKLMANDTIKGAAPLNINYRRQMKWTPKYESFAEISPSFIDSSAHLTHNLINEYIIEALLEDTCIGYLVFQPHLARLSQLAVSPAQRHHGVARGLFQQMKMLTPNKDITCINVPDTYAPFNEMLVRLGFVKQITQYELELVL